MSLINSAINQIGREIGKDIYKSAKKTVANKIETPESIVEEYESRNPLKTFLMSIIGLNPFLFKLDWMAKFNHLLGALVGLPLIIYYLYIIITNQ